MLLGQSALVAAALFTGAAFYINVAEQPGRLGLDDEALLAEWKTAYKRGFAMQASLAGVGFLLGIAAAFHHADWRWAIGAVLLVANWPFTLLAILPTNDLLMRTEPAAAGAASRASIENWGRLHAVRTALGAAATCAFLWASVA
jgi:hypothetical protein